MTLHNLQRRFYIYGFILTLIGISGLLFIYTCKGGLTCSTEVAQPTNATIPGSSTVPSDDRVTVDPTSGAVVAKDEIIVSLHFGTPDPDRRIKEIANTTEGVIIGAVPGLLLYQLQYDVADLDALEQIRLQIEDMPDVESATKSYFVEPL